MLSCLFLGHYALKGILYFDTFFLTNKGQLKFKAVILKSNEPFLNEFIFKWGFSYIYSLSMILVCLKLFGQWSNFFQLITKKDK